MPSSASNSDARPSAATTRGALGLLAHHWAGVVRAAQISRFDFVVVLLLSIGGATFLWGTQYWGFAMIGDSSYGDAEFWWRGAIHVSEGIFADNPGKGYRPGYFVLTGLAMPVLGTDFPAFHKFFIVVFLASVIFFYLAMRMVLGRWGSAFAAALLVFNPFTAEWVATSTTDATGLMFHLSALSCLAIGMNRNNHCGWISAFAMLFAIGTLTRPIVTPFIAAAIFALLIVPRGTWRGRFKAAAWSMAAFAAPLLVWMGIQKAFVGEWSISTNDAGALYAASDPKIQVWNTEMYAEIQKLSGERFETSAPTIAMLNETFRQETYANYFKHYRYHIERFAPHLWVIAEFSPKTSVRGTERWRCWLLMTFAAGSAIGLLLQRAPLRAAFLVATAVVLMIYPEETAYFTCAGAVLGLATFRSRDARSVMFPLTLYWLIGVAALFLTGGTWGPPLGPTMSLNALGYRLGLQVFFLNDLLAVAGLTLFATWRLAPAAERSGLRSPVARIIDWGCSFGVAPRPLGGTLVVGSLLLVIVATTSVYGVGSAIIAKRWYARNFEPARSYPDLREVAAGYPHRTNADTLRIVSDVLSGLYFGEKSVSPNGSPAKPTDSGEVVVSGAASSFVWNLAGQRRSQMMVYQQEVVHPFTMGRKSLIVELPRQFRVADWAHRPGAFILQEIADSQNKSNLPYYLTVPAVRGFVPLKADGQGFALDQSIWFPLVKYASQLDGCGELECRGGKITWGMDSGPRKHQRRFFLAAADENTSGVVSLAIDLAKNPGATTLRFAAAADAVPGTAPTPAVSNVGLVVDLLGDSARLSEALYEGKVAPQLPTDTAGLNEHEFALTDSVAESLELRFAGLTKGSGVWVYELNLEIDDRAPSAENAPRRHEALDAAAKPADGTPR